MKSRNVLFKLVIFILVITSILSLTFHLYSIFKNRLNKEVTSTKDSIDFNISIDKNNFFKKYNLNLKKTKILGNLEILQSDFAYRLTWDSAMLISKELNEGWRLPNAYELNLLFQNRKKIGGFEIDKYWTSDIYTEGVTAYEQYFNYQGFRDVSPIYSKYKVRFVRNID